MDTSALNAVDLCVIAILAMSGILALIRGLVKEVVVLGVWVGSVILTARLYPVAKPWMATHIKSEIGADAATALALFALCLIILIPLGNIISSMIKGETLTAIDRALGFVFGVVRGLLVVCLIYLGATWVWPKPAEQPDLMKKAQTQPILAYGADIIKAVVPQESLKETEKEVKETKENAEKAAKSAEEAAKNAKDLDEQLNKLSTPTPAAPTPENKAKQQPSYNSDSRSDLNKLINQKGK